MPGAARGRIEVCPFFGRRYGLCCTSEIRTHKIELNADLRSVPKIGGMACVARPGSGRTKLNWDQICSPKLGGGRFLPLVMVTRLKIQRSAKLRSVQIWTGLLKFQGSVNLLKIEGVEDNPKLDSHKKPQTRTAQGIDKIKICGYTENRKGAAGKRLAPYGLQRSNRMVGSRAVTSFYWPQ